MNSGETEVSIRVEGISPANPRVPSVPLSINFFLAGVIFPISCLIHSYCGLNANLDIPWQSGEPVVYIGLLLACPSILAFLPMMLFSMACITIWVFNPSSSHFWLIRYGNYLGLVLCIQVFVMIVFVTGPITLFAAIIVGPAMTLILYSLKSVANHYRRFTIARPLRVYFTRHLAISQICS